MKPRMSATHSDSASPTAAVSPRRCLIIEALIVIAPLKIAVRRVCACSTVLFLVIVIPYQLPCPAATPDCCQVPWCR